MNRIIYKEYTDVRAHLNNITTDVIVVFFFNIIYNFIQNQKKQRKRKVFRKMENLFVIDGIDLSASKESDVCDKETQCSNEEGEAFIGASVFIKEESMDHEEGSESSFGNEDWNICDGLQIKREVCIKEEDI